jgi:putative Mg2+ transporter-C (MgtC) family protein
MSNADQFEIVTRLLLALALGAAVGLQRDLRGHEAGIRTFALVCLGAALFGEVGTVIDDPRIAAGVVGGIGFLGAGLIIRGDAGIRGITTAVTTWTLAAVGLAVALGIWVVAVAVTAAIILLLELAPLSQWIQAHGSERSGDSPDPPTPD